MNVQRSHTLVCDSTIAPQNYSGDAGPFLPVLDGQPWVDEMMRPGGPRHAFVPCDVATSLPEGTMLEPEGPAAQSGWLLIHHPDLPPVSRGGYIPVVDGKLLQTDASRPEFVKRQSLST